LACLAEKWNFPLAADVAHRVLGFVQLLMTWNARVNLTGARSAAEIVGEHVVDAFAMARMVPTGSSVVDVGSGGGLPGLAFAILRPDARVTLVEPRAKRVAFLNTVVRELQLAETAVFRGRADAMVAAAFDVAISRATFPPAEWLGIGLDLVRPHGIVLVLAAETWVPGDSALRATNEVRYATAGGRGRWIGAFCST
jgi:16S rRNA (guanine527-N7)-methyltransferase